MFFQNSFYPAGAYPCASCDTIIYNPNPLTLSQNNVLMCTSCLHGPSANFPSYNAQPTTYSLFNTVVNSANLAGHHQQVLNPFSQPENRVIGGKDSIQVTNEIDSWLVLDPERQGKAKIDVPPCMEANNNLDTSSYWPYSDQIEYNYLYDNLREAFQPTENVVSVQALADQAHNFNMGLEHEALGASTFQTPSSMLAASSFQCTDALIVAEATNRCSINLDYMTGEGASGSSSCTRTAPIIPPKYSPWFRKMRVLRYRHKKKQRKFGNTVRYNSRRANAETRRRVRGRFVRNT